MTLVDAALVDFIYLVFTRMPGYSYCRCPYMTLVDAALVDFIYLVFTRMPGYS